MNHSSECKGKSRDDINVKPNKDTHVNVMFQVGRLAFKFAQWSTKH